MEDLSWEDKFYLVCVEVENGRPLRKACPEFMGLEKFYQLLKDNEALSKRYACACEARADKIFDDMLVISDDNTADTFVDGSGLERTNTDVIQRSKLMIDTRKWVLSKMAPKKYGDKIDVTSDGEKLTTTIINLGKGVKPPEDGTAD